MKLFDSSINWSRRLNSIGHHDFQIFHFVGTLSIPSQTESLIPTLIAFLVKMGFWRLIYSMWFSFWCFVRSYRPIIAREILFDPLIQRSNSKPRKTPKNLKKTSLLGDEIGSVGFTKSFIRSYHGPFDSNISKIWPRHGENPYTVVICTNARKEKWSHWSNWPRSSNWSFEWIQ